MILIRANCRSQITSADVDFIAGVLGHKPEDRHFLTSLLADEASRDLLLDSEPLHRALLEARGCLSVSSHLYFYVVVRKALRDAGLDDRDVADYVAELLAEFSSAERGRCRAPGRPEPMDYLFEMVGALRDADERTTFALRSHIANHALFITGIFPERIRMRAERKGFPDLSYYERLGQSCYRIAGDHKLACRLCLERVYAVLAEKFRDAREALNDLSDRILSLADGGAPSDHLLITALRQPFKP